MNQSTPKTPAAANVIEVRIDTIAQLFHTLDPYPFRERDLDKDAEEFIVGWARELPRDQPLTIVVHLPDAECALPAAQELGPALQRYFEGRSDRIGLELKELLRVGRRSLAIGLSVLALSLLASQTLRRLAPPTIGRLIEESLLIFGWVANWRPIEIFLYEWWPITRRRDLFRRLATARVELRPFKPAAA